MRRGRDTWLRWENSWSKDKWVVQVVSLKTVGFRARSAYLGSILCCLIPVRKVSFINILYASNSYALGGKNQNDVFEERPRVMIGVSSAQTSIYKLDLYESL